MVIRVFVASSSGFVAVSTAGVGSRPGARGAGVAGPPGSEPCWPLRVPARDASTRWSPRRPGAPSHLDNNEQEREEKWVGGPCAHPPAHAARARGAPTHTYCVAQEFGEGVVLELVPLFHPTRFLSSGFSRFGTFSQVIFYTGCFFGAKTRPLPNETSFSGDLLSHLPSGHQVHFLTFHT